MASKNDITLDVIYNRPTEQFRKNLENVDFSIKLTDQVEAVAPPAEVCRYMEVSPDKFSTVMMDYYHPDHNLMLTFDGKTGRLLSADVLGDTGEAA